MKLRRRPVLSRDPGDEEAHILWCAMRSALLENEIEHLTQGKGFSPVCCLMWFRSVTFAKAFLQIGHRYFGNNLLELDIPLSVEIVPAWRASWKIYSLWESVEKMQSLHFHSFFTSILSIVFDLAFSIQLSSLVCLVTSCDKANRMPHRGHLYSRNIHRHYNYNIVIDYRHFSKIISNISKYCKFILCGITTKTR